MIPPKRGREGRLGKYRLVRRLAAGGLSDLYLGHEYGHTGYLRTVVLKTIRTDVNDRADLNNQLLEEARLATLLNHENLIRTIAVGEDGDTTFLVLEFVFGRTLQQLLDRCHAMGVSIRAEHLRTILGDALLGLDYAHRYAQKDDGQPLSLVHRDISPANIMVGFDGVVRLLDFGLAKSESQLTRTRAGVIKGRYEYMSPEQALREKLDGRSDLFSLGAVMWETLGGESLFRCATEIETIKAVTRKHVPFPPTHSAGLALAWTTYRALRRPRWLRYRHAGAMRESVLRFEERSEEVARDELQSFMASLFHVELSARDHALQRARNQPLDFRKIRDSGFELLPEVTDPAVASMPHVVAAPQRRRSRRPSWYLLGALATVLVSLGLGVLIGRSRAPLSDVGYLYVLSDREAAISVGETSLGTAPVQRVPVYAGRHRIRAQFEDSEQEVVVYVKPGQNRLVTLNFSTSPAK